MGSARAITLAILVVGCLALGGASQADAQAVDFWLTVLHHSDSESQLIELSQNPDFGGIARFKALADQLKADAVTDPDTGVVMLSSGDNFLAGPEFNASLTKGVPYYDSIGLDLVGYDALCLGNHDFDFGPEILADFLDGFSTTQPPYFLGANIDFSGEPSLQALVTSGDIAKSTVVTTNGEQIGVIGAITPNLPFISSPGNVQVDPDVAGAVQAEVASLTASGVDKIILISHLQSVNEDLALIPQVEGVDVFVSGGGDDLLANPDAVLIPGDAVEGPYPMTATDKGGRTVPVVSTKGDYSYIGRLQIGFDAGGEIVQYAAGNNPLRVSGVAPDAVAPDPAVYAQVTQPVADAVANMAAHVIAQSQVDLDGRGGSVRTKETNYGDLVADALLWNARQLAPGFGAPPPDIALQNGGAIRNDSVVPAGDYTELDTFDALPFPSFIVIVPDISPAKLKTIMENAVSRVELRDGRFIQIAGFSMRYDPAGQAQIIDPATELITTHGSRVREIRLDDGRYVVRNGAIPPSAPRVDIATIDFVAKGGDQAPFDGAPFIGLGKTYQRSLQDYVEVRLAGLIAGGDYPVEGLDRIVARSNDSIGGVAVGDVDLGRDHAPNKVEPAAAGAPIATEVLLRLLAFAVAAAAAVLIAARSGLVLRG